MKSKKNTTVQEELSQEQLVNNEVVRVFELITQSAQDVVRSFESKKYRTSVLIDHMQNNNNNLIKEYLSYFFNVTLTRNKNSLLVIYIGFDSEAITRFGSMLHNQFIRQIMAHTAKENTLVDIESYIRIDAGTKEVRNYFYKRITDGESDYVNIRVDDVVAA
jgi:hypothetical protein